jgi:hypothetical protein
MSLLLRDCVLWDMCTCTQSIQRKRTHLLTHDSRAAQQLAEKAFEHGITVPEVHCFQVLIRQQQSCSSRGIC